MHRQITAHIICSKGAHLWRTVFAQAGHSPHYCICSKGAPLTPHIVFSEGAHLWRKYYCTGRSQLTFYSLNLLNLLTCVDSFFHSQVTFHLPASERNHLWRTVSCTGRSQPTLHALKVPNCGGQFFAQSGHSSDGAHLWR